MQIKIKIDKPQWLRAEEKVIIDRVAAIVRGTSEFVSEKKDGYKWMLDTSNDWWAEIATNDSVKELIVAYRYGHAASNQKMMAALQSYLGELFGETF